MLLSAFRLDLAYQRSLEEHQEELKRQFFSEIEFWRRRVREKEERGQRRTLCCSPQRGGGHMEGKGENEEEKGAYPEEREAKQRRSRYSLCCSPQRERGLEERERIPDIG